MCAFNQPKNTDDATINKVRGAILHRGLWMGLILKEAKKRGLDWESIGLAPRTGAVVRDLWAKKDLATVSARFETEVAPHDVAFLRISPKF